MRKTWRQRLVNRHLLRSTLVDHLWGQGGAILNWKEKSYWMQVALQDVDKVTLFSEVRANSKGKFSCEHSLSILHSTQS